MITLGKKKLCGSRYIAKKIRAGRSLLKKKSKNLFIVFPDFNKKHNRCLVCPKYIMKRSLFGQET